ncbi:unnamed protein product [Didymodactylos carnosus]|nr:unnamed protein product [Didymodactylos carnosus]CAF3609353.1 unnamed protein product [Didymodactylos carnosus]
MGREARYKETAERIDKLSGRDVWKSDIVKKNLSVLINDILLECYFRPLDNTFGDGYQNNLAAAKVPTADYNHIVPADIDYTTAFPTAIGVLYNDTDQTHVVYNAVFTLIGFIDFILSKYKIQKQFASGSLCSNPNSLPSVDPDLYGPNASLENMKDKNTMIKLWRGWMLTCLDTPSYLLIRSLVRLFAYTRAASGKSALRFLHSLKTYLPMIMDDNLLSFIVDHSSLIFGMSNNDQDSANKMIQYYKQTYHSEMSIHLSLFYNDTADLALTSDDAIALRHAVDKTQKSNPFRLTRMRGNPYRERRAFIEYMNYYLSTPIIPENVLLSMVESNDRKKVVEESINPFSRNAGIWYHYRSPLLLLFL